MKRVFNAMLEALGAKKDDGWRHHRGQMRRRLASSSGYEFRPMTDEEREMVEYVEAAWPKISQR